MKLSVVIPAHNEEGCIEDTVRALAQRLTAENIEHEILVVNDGSLDQTGEILLRLEKDIPTLRHVINSAPNGFGSRFMRGSRIYDYPAPKLLMNRMANTFIRLLFGFRYNDVTNAFKLYRRCVVEGLRPLLSHHFNLTVELPLKAIVRGYSYAVLPNDWINRETGVSKLKIKEMGSRYLFIVLYCFIEKWLSRGDYRRPKAEVPADLTEVAE